MSRAALLAALLAAACRRAPAPPPPDLRPPAEARPAVEAPPPPPKPIVDIEVRPPLRCPAEMVPILVINGCIDRYEASAGKGKLGDPDGKGTTVVAQSVAGKPPLANVTHAQAKQACANAGKRLCLDAEWVVACLGKRPVEGGLTYPYGPQYEERRCFDWHASDHGRLPPVATGSYPRCVTPTGIFDMANNVGEITDGATGAGLHRARGGSLNHVIVDSTCEESTKLNPPDHYPSVGFRCCSDGLPPAAAGK